MAKATMRSGDAPVTETTAETPEVASDNVITDMKGRKITLRTLSVIEEMRLLKMLGEYNSSYYNFCAQVARVAAIDGNVIPVPNSEREVEAVAGRLGKEGVAALMSSLVTAAETDDKGEKDAIKK